MMLSQRCLQHGIVLCTEEHIFIVGVVDNQKSSRIVSCKPIKDELEVIYLCIAPTRHFGFSRNIFVSLIKPGDCACVHPQHPRFWMILFEAVAKLNRDLRFSVEMAFQSVLA
jgi:hypothetical protein